MRNLLSGWKPLVAGSVALAVCSVGLCVADDDAAKPKYTVKEVMEKAHKGATPQDNNNTLYAKVQSGRATKEENDQLVEYYKALAANDMPKDAPRGSAEDWKKRTTAMLAAAEKIDAGDKTAGAELKTAADCRGCHTQYRKQPARRGA